MCIKVKNPRVLDKD